MVLSSVSAFSIPPSKAPPRSSVAAGDALTDTGEEMEHKDPWAGKLAF